MEPWSKLPTNIMLNAYSAGAARGGARGTLLGKDSLAWILNEQFDKPQPAAKLWSDDEPSRRFEEWDESKGGVGWSLMLPVDEDMAIDQQPASPKGAPEPLRVLWEHRGEPPIYRYDLKSDFIIRCSTTDGCQPVDAVDSPFGCGVNSLPFYLLVCGSPDQIPWHVQYTLNGTRAVGRLHLDGDGLRNYVCHLMMNWDGCLSSGTEAVIWAVDHHSEDMTRIMLEAIANKLHSKLALDRNVAVTYLQGSQATKQELISAVGSQHPGLIVTTSHGSVAIDASLEDRAIRLGNLVDQEFQELTSHEINTEDIGGAIWYAHACCSGGSDKLNRYSGLLAPDCEALQTIEAAVEIGPRTASFPSALLGSNKPLRAFIGKIDPTFDWTIREPNTEQHLTAGLTAALYGEFYRKEAVPIGLAFRRCFDVLGGAYTKYDNAMQSVKSNKGDVPAALLTVFERLLMARDLQSTVILGDPTVKRPPASV